MSESPLSLLKFLLTRRWASFSAGTSLSLSIIIQLIYQIFKILDLYQKNVLEHSVNRERRIIIFLMFRCFDVSDVIALFLLLMFSALNSLPSICFGILAQQNS